MVACTALVLAACGGSSGHATKSKHSKRIVATTTTTAGPITYQVKSGDTLTNIAHFFGYTTSFLASYNHLTNGDRLMPGQTLQIPPRPPLKLVVAPPVAGAGESFTFNMTGAKSGENVIFTITDPKGGTFKGVPHAAGDDGSVMATYQPSISAISGVYRVVGTGDQGSTASGTFRISASAPIS